MAGRAAVLSEAVAGGGEADGHPCVPGGHSGTYQYGGKTMDMKGATQVCSAVWRVTCAPGVGGGAAVGWQGGGRRRQQAAG